MEILTAKHTNNFSCIKNKIYHFKTIILKDFYFYLNRKIIVTNAMDHNKYVLNEILDNIKKQESLHA